jgi:hypothetical protein
LVAPVFLLAVLGFLAFAGLVMASVGALLRRGDPPGSGDLTLGPWQLWAFVGWLVTCAAIVVGGTFVERRKRIRRGVSD